jgi:hypothetical protein
MLTFTTDYPSFFDVLWTMLIFFLWIAWFWILFRVLIDVFRRHDLSGWGKTGWIIFTICLPFLGVFVYVITQSEGMTKRDLEHVRGQKEAFDEYVRQTAGAGGGSAGAAAEIEKAKALLDSGAIDQAEFDALKRKALAGG